jgi:hypothetical protein
MMQREQAMSRVQDEERVLPTVDALMIKVSLNGSAIARRLAMMASILSLGARRSGRPGM